MINDRSEFRSKFRDQLRKSVKLGLLGDFRYLLDRFEAYQRRGVMTLRLQHTIDPARIRCERYEFRPNTGRISIFPATDSRFRQNRESDPRRFWGKMAEAGVDYHEGSVDHHTMIHEHLDELSWKFKRYLSTSGVDHEI